MEDGCRSWTPARPLNGVISFPNFYTPSFFAAITNHKSHFKYNHVDSAALPLPGTTNSRIPPVCDLTHSFTYVLIYDGALPGSS
eukprot:scaffold11286_cov98-Skeletonema_dohrnii-CCMP3373.AAC.1